MIIFDELSFKFVKNEGFRRFVEGTLMLVEPIVIPSRTTNGRDILEICANLGEWLLRDIFVNEGYRVSLRLILGHRFKMLII